MPKRMVSNYSELHEYNMPYIYDHVNLNQVCNKIKTFSLKQYRHENNWLISISLHGNETNSICL